MRKIIAAALGVLVALGLALLGAVTASAAAPAPSELAVCADLRVALKAAQDLIVVTDPAKVDATHVLKETRDARIRQAETDLRNNRCDGYTGGGNGDTFATCADYNRHGIFDIPRSDPRYRSVLDPDHDGLACEHREGDNPIVSNDGRCVTFLNDNRTYGTRYNDRVRELARDAERADSDGGTRITDAEWRRIQDAADVRDYLNRWTRSRDDLKTICKDETPPVMVIQQPTQVTVTQAPPAPPVISSGGGIPRGSVNSGGEDVAFVLAHSRVR